MAEVPPTDEGWFALHDFREIEWQMWRDMPEREQEDALEEITSFLRTAEDDGDGETAVFSIAGHKADLLVLHLRPTLDAVERLERAFEGTAFGALTSQTSSFVSVTEIGGYTAPEYFEDPESVGLGLRRYMESKKHPTIPEGVYVSFYPMAKRRDPEYNWYDTPLEERAKMMEEHGETGKSYAGTVTQIVTSALGLDDWEWGVTLFSNEATALKDIVYEMRFDEATAKYGEFGPFYVGRRFPIDDLGAFMAGETVPVELPERDSATSTGSGHPGGHGEAGSHPHGDEDGAGPGEVGESPHGETDSPPHAEEDSHPHAEEGGPPQSDENDSDAPPLREELADLDVYAGKPHGEDVYALALYCEADPDELADEVYGLRSNFDHYDTHVKTAVYEPREAGNTAVVSIWETESAADTASGFLSELPGIVGRPGEAEDGWGTMGMFYTVDPDHRQDFVDTFDDVGKLLADMDGHRETTLLVNREDETDMFIASQWDAREHAMEFFRSDAFGETVSFGRDILTDRPRHVFMA